MWNPWRGCKKCSDGCKFCYIHKGDYKRKVDTSKIVKTKDFYKPIEKLKNGTYKKDAVAQFNNDKNFETWFESFKAKLENAIKK